MRTCEVAGCVEKHHGKGLCRVHYERWKRNGDPLLLQRPGGTCSVDGCERPVVAHRLCKPHYRREAKYGDPLATTPPPVRKDPYERWRAMVDKQEGCWLWTGGVSTNGYGNFWLDGRTVAAHRWSYERHVGPVPSDLQIDHLCRERRCVNPAHLEAVTSDENNRRSRSPSATNATKTHCPQGHLYDEKNTYTDKQGRRSCRICRAEAVRLYLARKRSTRRAGSGAGPHER